MKTENLQPSQSVKVQTHLQTAAKQAYSQQCPDHIDDQQITALLPMVHKIVQRVVSYIKPPLSYEDLVSAGTVGLVKAAQDFDPSNQAQFNTYAYIRIRGAVLDELRNFSFVPANVDKQIKQTYQCSNEIAKHKGSLPTDEELAAKLKISIVKLRQTFESARAKQFVSIDNSDDNVPSIKSFLVAANTSTPDKQLEKSELIDKLADAITSLNEKQRKVIILYYKQGLTMKQIAELFNITEPRVSQLHAGALFNLSVKLRQWKNDK